MVAQAWLGLRWACLIGWGFVSTPHSPGQAGGLGEFPHASLTAALLTVMLSLQERGVSGLGND